MSDKIYMSQDGYDKLKEEINQLKTVERRKLSKIIGEAIDLGDLSENAEYHAAKEAQGLLEAKINRLEGQLGKARVMDESKIDLSKVVALTTVTVKNVKMNKEFKYTLVAESEADIKTGKISLKSPIGQGLLGAKVGDVVDIKVPNGIMQFEIMDITV
jgi:transcription elongation factor GreA